MRLLGGFSACPMTILLALLLCIDLCRAWTPLLQPPQLQPSARSFARATPRAASGQTALEACGLRDRVGVCGLVGLSHSSDLSDKGPRTPTHRVAFSVGFVGSQYHGYQADSRTATIEQALRNACMELKVAPWKTKIKPAHRWTASSRTDARVHAARLVIVAPLCLPAALISGSGAHLMSALNAQLVRQHDSDIVIHAARILPPVLSEFDARAHCSHREYSYVVPLAAIGDIAPAGHVTVHDALERAKRVCLLYQGAHHFHNFCAPTRVPQLRDYSRRFFDAMPFSAKKLREQDPVEVLRLAESAAGDEGFEKWPAKMVRGCRADVYSCQVSLSAAAGEAADCAFATECSATLVFTVSGSGFMYNQIRYMVGAMMYVAAGVVPEEVIEHALSSRVALRLPLAPVRLVSFCLLCHVDRCLGSVREDVIGCICFLEHQACGLCLRSQGFAFSHQLKDQPIFEVNSGQAELLHGELARSAVCLEDDGAALRAESFYAERVLPEIHRAWSFVAGWRMQEAEDDGEEGAGGEWRRDARLWRWQFRHQEHTAVPDGALLRTPLVDSKWVTAWRNALADDGPAGGLALMRACGESADEAHERARVSAERRLQFVRDVAAGRRTDVLASSFHFPPVTHHAILPACHCIRTFTFAVCTPARNARPRDSSARRESASEASH